MLKALRFLNATNPHFLSALGIGRLPILAYFVVALLTSSRYGYAQTAPGPATNPGLSPVTEIATVERNGYSISGLVTQDSRTGMNELCSTSLCVYCG